MTPQIAKLEALLARIARNRSHGMPTVSTSPSPAAVPVEVPLAQREEIDLPGADALESAPTSAVARDGIARGHTPASHGDVAPPVSSEGARPASVPADAMWDDMAFSDDVTIDAPRESLEEPRVEDAVRRSSRTPLELAVEVELERVQQTEPGATDPASSEVTRLDIEAAVRAAEAPPPSFEQPLSPEEAPPVPTPSFEPPSFDDITLPRTDLTASQIVDAANRAAAPAHARDELPVDGSAPQRIAPASVAPPSQPIARTVGAAPEATQLTFGECLRRSLALRPR